MSIQFGKKITITQVIILISFLLVSFSSSYATDKGYGEPPTAKRKLNITTQGPPWPPSTVVDKDGNFVVVGTVLTETEPGVIVPIPNAAALVSKDTIPPLDANGTEDFTNFFGAPYKIIRRLDLMPGSTDLNIELYTPSIGPVTGEFGGGPRVPMEGESPYNLNMTPSPCPEVFPSTSQLTDFKRRSYPLHQYPIRGFQGDQVAYDINTDEPYDPMTRSGSGCGVGCSGENEIDFRREKPIILGEWLKARGRFKIKLTRYDEQVGGYTAAKFNLKFRGLLPKSVYTAWALRENVLTQGRLPGPLGIPSVFVTDEYGNADFNTELPNPFPTRTDDEEGLRVVGIEISYHPDYQNWGACAEAFGVGYRLFSWFDILPDGSRDLENLITLPPVK